MAGLIQVLSMTAQTEKAKKSVDLPVLSEVN